MSDLKPLHILLQTIGRRRRFLRYVIGGSGLVAVVSATWLGLFALDWGLGLGVAERVVVVLAAAVAAAWAVRRFAWPWLRLRESELQLALLLQRQEGIDTDLVAAIQFENAHAQPWGSPELRAAVIRQVADLAPRLPLRDDIPRRTVRQRALVGGIALALAGASAVLFPDHVRVFLLHLLLRSAAYPTATRIDELRVAGQAVELGSFPVEVACPSNTPIAVTAKVTGRIPRDGVVQIAALASPQSTRIHLSAEGEAVNVFSASLPLLTTACQCRIELGDATAGPILLRPAVPPQVRIAFQIHEPDYGTATDRRVRWQQDILQLTVAEGATVQPWLISDRPLRRGMVRLGDGHDAIELQQAASPPDLSIPNAPAPHEAGANRGEAAPPGPSHSDSTRSGSSHADSAHYFFTLARPQPALAEITEPVRLEFDGEDLHGWQATRLRTIIFPRPDQPPRIQAQTRISLALPRAKPTVVCRASDDRGLVRIDVRAERVQTDGSTEVLRTWALWRANRPGLRELDEHFSLDLAATGTVKGDRLRIFLMAVEQGRKGQPGRSVDSTPIELTITDEQGILAAMTELDRKSADQLQQMVDRQLEVGGTP